MAEEKRLKARVAHKHKTEAEWRLDVYDGEVLREDAFVPLDGELIIFDPDPNSDQATKRFKFGDGVTNVIDLPFASSAGLNTEGTGENAVQQENAKAFAPDSAAFGANTIAGGKAFAINIEKEQEATTTTTLRGMSNQSGTYFVDCAASVLEELSVLVEDWLNETDTTEKNNKRVYYSVDYSEVEYEEDGTRTQPEGVYSNVYPDCGYITEVDIENQIITVSNKFNISWDPSRPDRFTTEACLLTPIDPTIGDIEYGFYAFVANEGNLAMGHYSMANGRNNQALDNAAHAEGHTTIALKYAHSEGTRTKALGRSSHAEGRYSIAYAFGAHAEGYNTKAIAPYSHSEGKQSIAGNPDKIDDYTYRTDKTPITAHAEGDNTIAVAPGSHTEGNKSLTGYKYFEIINKDVGESTEEGEIVGTCPRLYLKSSAGLRAGQKVLVKLGDDVVVSELTYVGKVTHKLFLSQTDLDKFNAISATTGRMVVLDDPTIGEEYCEDALYAHAEGDNTVATTRAQHVYGAYNIPDLENKYIEIAGNGNETGRSNAYTLDKEGNAWFAGEIKIGEEGLKLISEQESKEYADELNTALAARVASLENKPVVATLVENAQNAPGPLFNLDTTTGTVKFLKECFAVVGNTYTSIPNGTECTGALSGNAMALVCYTVTAEDNTTSKAFMFKAISNLKPTDTVLFYTIRWKSGAYKDPDSISIKCAYTVNDELCQEYKSVNDAIVYVSPTGKNTNSGLSADAPLLTINNAVALAKSKGIKDIALFAGTYYQTVDISDMLDMKLYTYAEATGYSGNFKFPKAIIDGRTSSTNTTVARNYCGKFTRCDNLVLENIVFQHCANDVVHITLSNNVKIDGCEFHYAGDGRDSSVTGGNGLYFNSSSGTLINIEASYNHNDGVNLNGQGSTTVLNAYCHHNGYNASTGDGISHHRGFTGLVLGGEFCYNKKGGVSSPTFGAKIDICNVYTHDNGYGVYAHLPEKLDTETGEDLYADLKIEETIKVFSSNIKNNNVGILAEGYSVYSYNNLLENNAQDHELKNSGTIVQDNCNKYETLGGKLKSALGTGSFVQTSCGAADRKFFPVTWTSGSTFVIAQNLVKKANILNKPMLILDSNKELVQSVTATGTGTGANAKRIVFDGTNTTAGTGYITFPDEPLISIFQDVTNEPAPETIDYAAALGQGTTVSSSGQLASGRYNTEFDGPIVVGNGTDDENRSNAHTLDWSGNAWFAGDVTVGASKAQLVSSSEVKSIRVLILGAGEEPDTTTFEDGVLTIVIGGA